MWKFCEQFVGRFDAPQNSKLAKISILKFMFKINSHISFDISPIRTNEGSKFMSNGVKFTYENIYY